MVDNQPELTQSLQAVDQTADEAVQAAMVKTAIRANVGGASAEQTTSLTEVMDHMEQREEYLTQQDYELLHGAD